MSLMKSFNDLNKLSKLIKWLSTFLNLLLTILDVLCLNHVGFFICFIGIKRTIVFFPVKAQIVLVTEESIPPEIPTTKEFGFFWHRFTIV